MLLPGALACLATLLDNPIVAPPYCPTHLLLLSYAPPTTARRTSYHCPTHLLPLPYAPPYYCPWHPSSCPTHLPTPCQTLTELRAPPKGVVLGFGPSRGLVERRSGGLEQVM
eukprot:2014770-Rhodomonas_salina.1